MKSTIFITFLINVVITRHHYHLQPHHNQLVNILKTKENFFRVTNKFIVNIMNKLFATIKLRPEKIVNKHKIKYLRKMIYDLNNISSSNFDLFNVLKNITKVAAISEAIKRIRLDEMVRETIQEKQLIAYNDTEDKEYENVILRASTKAVTTLTTNMQPMFEFKDSREFKEFIGSLLRKIKTLTVDDLFEKEPSDGSDELESDLEVWEPPANLKWSSTTDYRKVLKGQKTAIRSFPFIASIHILQNFTCAGNIIKEDLVITAASCMQIHFNNKFFKENVRTTYVRVGSEYATQSGELIPVLEIYFNPMYEPKTLKNNLAILRLARNMKYVLGGAEIKRILLDSNSENLPSNTKEILLLGWSPIKPNQAVDGLEKLQVSFVSIYPLDKCQKIYSREYINQNNFCVDYFARRASACNKDVGGAAVVGDRLIGIVSFGPHVCGNLDFPTVYTRIGNYIDWIEEVIQISPPRANAPRTIEMTSRDLVYYYNTVNSHTYSTLTPIAKESPYTREDANKETEETVLKEIATGMKDKNISLVNEVFNEAFSEDFDDINSSRSYIQDMAKSVPNNKILGTTADMQLSTVSDAVFDTMTDRAINLPTDINLLMDFPIITVKPKTKMPLPQSTTTNKSENSLVEYNNNSCEKTDRSDDDDYSLSNYNSEQTTENKDKKYRAHDNKGATDKTSTTKTSQQTYVYDVSK